MRNHRHECQRCHVGKFLREFTCGREGTDFSACRSCKTQMAREGTSPKKRQNYYRCEQCAQDKHSRAFRAGDRTCIGCNGGRARKPITGISHALNAWLCRA